jgi:hypothetical protein
LLASAAEARDKSRVDGERDAVSLPSLDERVDLFLRAWHGDGRSDFTELERASMRSRILDAMVTELADEAFGGTGKSGEVDITGRAGEAATALATRYVRHGRDWLLSFVGAVAEAVLIPLTTPAIGRMRFAAAALLLVAGAAWTGAWFYAARTAEQAFANWTGRDAHRSGSLDCASRTTGGFPLRLEINCTDPKIIVVAGDSTYAIDAKGLHLSGSVLHPSNSVAEVTGPVSISEPGSPAALVGDWTKALGTLRTDAEGGDQVAFMIDAFQFSRTTPAGMEPLLSGDQLSLGVKRDTAQAAGTHDVEITAHLEGGSLPVIREIPSDPFVADVTALLHDVAPAPAAPFVARLREWQAGGGKLEIASAQIQQSGASATGRGVIELTPTGHVEGNLLVAATGFYVQTAQTLMGSAVSNRVAQSPSPDERTRAVRPAEPQQEPPRTQPTSPLDIPIRFDDGAIYAGPILLGRIPPLF